MFENGWDQMTLLGFFGIGTPGLGEMVVIGIVAVVLFGSRLPEVARSLGSSYQQFRKGLSEIQSSIKDDLDLDADLSNDHHSDFSDTYDDYDEPTAPKLEAPPEEVS